MYKTKNSVDQVGLSQPPALLKAPMLLSTKKINISQNSNSLTAPLKTKDARVVQLTMPSIMSNLNLLHMQDNTITVLKMASAVKKGARPASSFKDSMMFLPTVHLSLKLPLLEDLSLLA